MRDAGIEPSAEYAGITVHGIVEELKKNIKVLVWKLKSTVRTLVPMIVSKILNVLEITEQQLEQEALSVQAAQDTAVVDDGTIGQNSNNGTNNNELNEVGASLEPIKRETIGKRIGINNCNEEGTSSEVSHTAKSV